LLATNTKQIQKKRLVVIRLKFLAVACILSFVLLSSFETTAVAQQPLQFKVQLGSETTTQPVSGRVYVFLSERNRQPMNGPNWFNPEPFFGVDVTDFSADKPVAIDNDSQGVVALNELESGEYYVQAVLDQDFYFANHAKGPGNLFSRPKKIKLDPDSSGVIELELTEVVTSDQLDDTEFFKVVKLNSKLLSDFHKREVIERAGVVLPPSYNSQPERRYPVYYEITGFGGTLVSIAQRRGKGQRAQAEDDAEFIKVYLTAQCKWGHHVYANSAINGPRGDAFIEEMIPHIDKTFRTIAQPTARFVGGHSSGGWSSLWLQVTYPETFGGVWSTAPDPVDFRDWQGTNLYDANGASVFVDVEGNKRPLARQGERPVLMYNDFCKMDDALGRGGQLRSFEAVFSPLGEDGLPAKCWDRETGQVNPQVVDYWKQYDISLQLEKNWSELGPKLGGKLHVYMGDLDTFYLDGATRLLGERLKKLGSDAVVEMFPGKDHSSLLSRDLYKRISSEMTAKFREHHPEE
jgi:hypothetical protein